MPKAPATQADKWIAAQNQKIKSKQCRSCAEPWRSNIFEVVTAIADGTAPASVNFSSLFRWLKSDEFEENYEVTHNGMMYHIKEHLPELYQKTVSRPLDDES